MKPFFKISFLLLFSFFFPCGILNAQLDFQRLIKNEGQWDHSVLYKYSIPGASVLFDSTGWRILFHDINQWNNLMHHAHHKQNINPSYSFNEAFKYHLIHNQFINANLNNLEISDGHKYLDYRNYYLGKNPARWKSKVPVLSDFTYKNIYEGIDIHVKAIDFSFKYDIVIKPGADYSKIQYKISGADDIQLINGKLWIKTSLNEWVEEIPKSYQNINNKLVSVKCEYELVGDIVKFKVGSYNPNYELIIDPVLIFATYSGSTADNFGFTATFDSKACLYAGGNVTSADPIDPNGRYPATPGAFMIDFQGGNNGGTPSPYDDFECDIAISKYDSSGQNLIYATYLGGDFNDFPHSLIVDNNDNLIVLGSTFSRNFPVDTLGFDPSYNGGGDIIISRFNFDGTQLLGSTYFGGSANDGLSTPIRYNYADDFRGDIHVDFNNSIFIASCTRSFNFPLRDAIKSNLEGPLDGVLANFSDDLRSLNWSTYFGGKALDAAYSIKVDKDGYIFAAGGTNSDSLPNTDSSYMPQRAGAIDGFIAKFDPSDFSLLKCTYFGSPQYDQIYFIEIDRKRQVFVSGQTEGNLIRSANTYGKNGTGQFIAKLTNDLDTLLLNTTFGDRLANPEISPTAFLVDNCDNIYFSGWGSDLGAGFHAGTTLNLEITPDAIQSSTDGSDFYLLALNKDMQSLLFATYFGGTQSDDHVDGGTSRFDKRGVVYQSICGSCPPGGTNYLTDINTSPNSAFPTNTSPRCSNVSLKLDFRITYSIDAAFSAEPIAGCTPLTVDFTNKSTPGAKVKWFFGNGDSSELLNPQYTYNAPGNYKVTLIIIDSLSCNILDSVSRTITVFDKVEAVIASEAKPCSNEVKFSSQNQAREYFWDFGDGNTSNERNPDHKYENTGQYRIKLILNPNQVCADSIELNINLDSIQREDIVIPNVVSLGLKDGLNDCFKVKGLNKDCDLLKVEIVNRYGSLVYKSEEVDFCWDGKILNSSSFIPQGVYFVKIYYTLLGENEKVYTGTLTVIK